MARYVNPDICRIEYGVTLNCTIDYGDPQNTTVRSLGGILPGGFEGDPDIAGIGVLGAFVTVTLFSVFLSIGNTIWWISKNVLLCKTRISPEEKAEKNWHLSVSGFFETLVLTCSDQQIFTGGSYAITLRYSKACSISAYHYNIVANLLLFSCATHLMAVTIAKHYWQHPYIAALRIAITAVVYLVTGLTLSSQISSGVSFPTKVPRPSDQFSTMLLPAACFQSGQAALASDIQNAFNVQDVNSFFDNEISGFTQYLIMCMFYLVAVMVSVGRFVRRGADHNGRRKRFLEGFKRRFSLLLRMKRFFYFLFALYLVAGVGIASWAVQGAFLYVYNLRFWVRNSIWQNKHGDERTSEDDATTFGQLVPLLLISLTVFSFLQMLAEHLSVKKLRAGVMEEVESRQQDSTDDQAGKPTQVKTPTSTGYFDLPKINVDKSPQIGLAITELWNVTPGTTGSTPGATPVSGVPMQLPQPPHVQSRAHTWTSSIATGTTATPGSNRSGSYIRPQNGSQTYLAQTPQLQQQQQQPQPQTDAITPVAPREPGQMVASTSGSQTQLQPASIAPTGRGTGNSVISTALPASNVGLTNTVPVPVPATAIPSSEVPPQHQQPTTHDTVPSAMTMTGSTSPIGTSTPSPSNSTNTITSRGSSPPR